MFVESKLGSGSTFTVRFPVESDEFSPNILLADISKKIVKKQEIISKKLIKALYVDDDIDSLSVAEKYFSRCV